MLRPRWGRGGALQCPLRPKHKGCAGLGGPCRCRALQPYRRPTGDLDTLLLVLLVEHIDAVSLLELYSHTADPQVQYNYGIIILYKCACSLCL